jgi:hypothetical protein
MMLASTAAKAKASKAAVHYQDQPNGMQMCHRCKFYIGCRGGMMGGGMMGCGMMGGGMMGCGMMGGGMMRGGMMGAGACEVVEGRISPMGYCDLYAPRSA